MNFLVYEWPSSGLLCIQILTESLCQVCADGIQLYVYAVADCVFRFSVLYNSLGTDLCLPLLPLKDPWYRPLVLIYLLVYIVMGEEGLVWCNDTVSSGKLQITLV